MTISRNLSILAEGVSSSGVLGVTNGGTGVTTSTGSGSNVLSASPTLTGTLTVPTITSPASTALTLQSAGTTAMTINTSQNVGIGTSSPSFPITVSRSGVNTYLYQYDGTGAMVTGSNGSGLGISGTFSNTDMAFFSNSTECMRIDSSGNVGIGTSSPSSKLDVAGTIRSGSGGTDPGTGAAFYFVGSGQFQTVVAGAEFAVNTGSNNARTERMRIDASGNVGIGATANASAILDAQSTTKGIRFPNMTTTQKNAVSSPAAGLVVFDTTLAKLCVYSGSAWQTITSI